MDILASAIKLAEFAREEAGRLKVPMTFCVIDLHGNIVLKHRMTGANLISLEMAERKAYTVAALHMKTSEISALTQAGQPFHLVAMAAGDRYWTDGGGVPLSIDGQLVAGFGVSGGSVAQDVEVAEAAIRAFEAAR